MNQDLTSTGPNLIYLIVGASGTGKSTLVRNLIALERDMYRHVVQEAISTTTRGPRAGEVEGEHYFFVTPEAFHQMVDAGELAEHVCFGGNWYGITRAEIDPRLEQGDVMLVVEPAGMVQIQAMYPEQTVVVKLAHPGEQELVRRMLERKTPPDVIEKRLANDREVFADFPYDFKLEQNEPLKMARALHFVMRQARHQKINGALRLGATITPGVPNPLSRS